MTAKITQELITENYNRIPSQTLTLYVLMAIVLVSFCLAKIDNFAEPSLVLSFTLELQKTSSWRAGPSCFFRLKQQVTVSDQYVKTSTVN